MISDFEAENPGITVTFKLYSYNDYVTAIRTGLTSSDGPDLFETQPGDLVTNFGPLAVPLDDHLAATYGAGWADQFYAAGLSQLQLNGAQVSLPSYMSAAGFIYYNATILKANGVSVPTTFSEWKDACAKLASAGIACLAHGAKDAWVNTDVFLSLINSVAPGKVYDAIAGKVKWTDPAFVQAMDSWRELFTSDIIAKGSTAMAEYPDAFSEFLTGKAAFIALGTWNTPGTMTKTGMIDSQKTVTDPITGVFLSAPFPAPADNLKPTAPFGGPDNGWAVSAKSAHQEAALKFLDFLSVGGGQKLQAAVGNIPAVVSILVATSDVIDPSQAPDIERQQSDLKNMIGARQIPYSDLNAALGDALSAVAAGTSSSADALGQVESVSSSTSR
jgi:raffinose/stachyose/melibiose transport system substrate-binding protein